MEMARVICEECSLWFEVPDHDVPEMMLANFCAFCGVEFNWQNED